MSISFFPSNFVGENTDYPPNRFFFKFSIKFVIVTGKVAPESMTVEHENLFTGTNK